MSNMIKIVVFVPESHADAVRKAMGDAGAGVIGNYGYCTFSTKGKAHFKPLDGAKPAIGEVGEMEEVNEERIETVCEKDKLDDVIKAIKKAHLYEEPAIDIYPLEVV